MPSPSPSVLPVILKVHQPHVPFSVTITDLQDPTTAFDFINPPRPAVHQSPPPLAIQIFPAHQPHTMALNTTGSPSSGGDSHSPSPVLSDNPSSNASPVSLPSSLYTAHVSDEGDSSEHRSSRSTPTRAMSDLTRSLSAGKGGCWTCRVRRKKCDEEREGDSCKTCLRLKINCLGWGPKRPEWMRDKEKVAAYKASIKEQLSRAGLIRGQPRQAWHATASSTPIASSSTSAPPAVAGPGPRTLRRSSSSAHRHSYGVPAPYHVPGMMGPISGHVGPRDPHHASSMAPFVHHTMTEYPQTQYPYPPPTPTSPAILAPAMDDAQFGPFVPASIPGAPSPATPSTPTPTQEDYVLYYFEHVRRLQYVFAGDSLASTLYTIVLAEPDGAVATSICALASLYSTRMRIAQGLESPQPDPEQSLPKRFYNQALYQLVNAKNYSGQYTEHDAVAAVQLISYGLLNGGGTDWATVLEIACDWLAQTGIHAEENPKLTLLNMSPAGRFAAKATMWIDIFSSVTFMQPPRFLSLYRRLFGGGAGYWASAPHADLRMDALTGCPDEAILAVAEISALAHWKATELHGGSLSVRELIRRGDQIEQQLRQRSGVRQFDERERASMEPSLSSTPPISQAGGIPLPAAGPSSSVPRGMAASPNSPTEDARRLIAEIFREAAVLYLHTVLSESIPGVPEIVASVEQISSLLNKLPPSEFDRALVFPLFLTGCMTDNAMLRELVKHRFLLQDAAVGNVLLARTLMENVWARRASAYAQRPGGIVVDWREHLRDHWGSLLLI